MLDMVRQIARWIDSREALKIMNEVRLVEISASQRNFRPIQPPPGRNHAQHLLKPPYPAEQFRRYPDFLAKHFDESSRAQPNLIGHLGNLPRLRSLMKRIQRKRHR